VHVDGGKVLVDTLNLGFFVCLFYHNHNFSTTNNPRISVVPGSQGTSQTRSTCMGSIFYAVRVLVVGFPFAAIKPFHTNICTNEPCSIKNDSYKVTRIVNELINAYAVQRPYHTPYG
jgi:hypothetical protein